MHTISVLYCAHLCMKCSLGMSNFLEEISSLSHSVVSLYFFALITEEGFLISPCHSLELCIQVDLSVCLLLSYKALLSYPKETLYFLTFWFGILQSWVFLLHLIILGCPLLPFWRRKLVCIRSWWCQIPLGKWV